MKKPGRLVPLLATEEWCLHVALGFAERCARDQPHPQPVEEYLPHVQRARRLLIRRGVIVDLQNQRFAFARTTSHVTKDASS